MNYWLCIITRDNWSIVQATNIMGFRDESNLAKLNTDDLLVLYVKPKRISGIYKVMGKNLGKKIEFKGGEYPFQIKLNPVYTPEWYAKLVDRWEGFGIMTQLSFFKKFQHIKPPKRWGCLLRGRTLVALTKSDFDCLEKYLRGVNRQS